MSATSLIFMDLIGYKDLRATLDTAFINSGQPLVQISLRPLIVLDCYTTHYHSLNLQWLEWLYLFWTYKKVILVNSRIPKNISQESQGR